MGEIVGAGLISHAPTIMFDEATRKELNDGKEISLVPGLIRLRSEVFDRLEADTIVIIDSHWETTVEHVLRAHEHQSGIFTSSELPRGMAQIEYDYPGDPELAKLAAKVGEEMGTPTHASEDPYLPVYYATVNLVHYLRKDEKIVSISLVQTGETDDFMTMGEAIGEAVRRLDRRAIVLASGGLSHTFWPLKELPKHEASDPVHIFTPEARAADEQRLEWMKKGDHARIVDTMEDYFPHNPEGDFGHYLMMLGAIGGRDCIAPGEMFSDYENATGTGQVHVWFERPAGGWTG
ncbi:MAG: catechol 1,2-dioxygenase [Actinobacteria bacterium]|nr:MAG: catechol 1,2-dioxygenase [Actinomycetota bacterium]REK41037.1 MAG: catechol 1,2-dioxygenase [Actinomycetota bacterium]